MSKGKKIIKTSGGMYIFILLVGIILGSIGASMYFEQKEDIKSNPNIRMAN